MLLMYSQRSGQVKVIIWIMRMTLCNEWWLSFLYGHMMASDTFHFLCRLH